LTAFDLLGRAYAVQCAIGAAVVLLLALLVWGCRAWRRRGAKKQEAGHD